MITRILGFMVGIAIILLILLIRGLTIAVFFLKILPLLALLIVAFVFIWAAITND
jgi:hypothetical protein